NVLIALQPALETSHAQSADARSYTRRDAGRRSARLDVEIARTVVRAFVMAIPEGQRNAEKTIMEAMPCKGQNCNQARAFSALQTFSPSKCSAALGSPRLAAVAFLLRSAACANVR